MRYQLAECEDCLIEHHRRFCQAAAWSIKFEIIQFFWLLDAPKTLLPLTIRFPSPPILLATPVTGQAGSWDAETDRHIYIL